MNEHIPMGWLCPRCGHVWAPTVRECTCEPAVIPPELEPDTVLYVSKTLDRLGWVETRHRWLTGS